MTRFFGNVGYSATEEPVPGVAKEVVIERPYYGDVLGNTGKLVESDKLNDDIAIQGQISFVADPYAYQNFMNIKYIVWMGVYWKPASIDATRPPRIILRLGDVYNGPKAATSGASSGATPAG